MKLKINTIYTLLITSVLFTALNALITYDNIKEKESATAVIIHSHKTIQASTQLLALLMDMETGQRGYVITGNRSFLQSYQQALDMYHHELSRIKELAEQRTRDNRLEGAIILASEEEREHLDSMISFGYRRGGDTLYIQQATLSGKEKMDHLRRLVNQLTLLEQSILEDQNGVLAENKRVDPIRFGAFGLIGITGVLMMQIETEFRERAERKGITLTIGKQDFSFEADPDALSRILENLLSNALKFSAPQTEVSIVATKDERWARFDITDEGPGITEEELPKLFKKFQRLSNRPTHNESSTGLGLSIVKELVSLHGGEVTVYSQSGEGSTFSILLPIAPAIAPAV